MYYKVIVFICFEFINIVYYIYQYLKSWRDTLTFSNTILEIIKLLKKYEFN